MSQNGQSETHFDQFGTLCIKGLNPENKLSDW